MPKKKKTGLHPGGLLPKIQPAVMPRRSPPVAKPPAKNRNTLISADSVSPIMDQFNKRSKTALDEFNRNVRTRQPTVGTTKATPSPSVSRPRGTDDAFMKKQQKMLEEFFRKNRKPRSVGRTARASGPGRRNRRAMPFRQPTFQPFRNYTYSDGGLTKSTTELNTGLKKAKDSK